MDAAPPPDVKAKAKKAAEVEDAPAKAKGPNLAGDVAGVRFHVGVQFGPLTRTGLDLEHCRKTLKIDDISMRIVGPGLWVRIRGKEYVVPFSNITAIELDAK